MNLLKHFFFLILILLSIESNAKICVIPIIKTMEDLVKKIKICDKGDKLYIKYDSKIIGEELIVNLCSLKDTVIFKEESKIIHKRKAGASLVCIYEPNPQLFN